MNRLTVLSSTSAAILAMTMAYGHFTATPAAAQGPQGGRPATDVNVINTPSVNVANTPTVNIGNTVPVQIQSPARQKVFIQLEASSADNFGSTPLAERYTVPAGKRLVITQISVEGTVPNPDRLIRARVLTENFELHSLDFSDARPTGTHNCYTGTHHFEWVLESGEVVWSQFQRTDTNDAAATTFTMMTGYLEDVP